MIKLDNMKITYSDDEIIVPVEGSKSIFLAGPTERISGQIGDGKYSHTEWRNEAISLLRSYNYDGLVCVPELKEREWTNDYRRTQIDWEEYYLDECGVILFWVPRKLDSLPGFTTNIEFGMYLIKRPFNMTYGHPEDAEKIEYMDIKYKKLLGRYPHLQLNDCIVDALSILSEITDVYV